MMRFAMLIAPAAVLAACNPAGNTQDAADGGADKASAGATATAGAKATTAPGGPAVPVDVKEETDLYNFAFAYPQKVAEIPELKARLDKELESKKAALTLLAREAQAEAKDQGFPYNAYAEGTNWQVVTDTPRFLSLSAETYSYAGGAHPNSGSAALVWDREAKRAVKPLDFFISPEALGAAVKESYCAALDKERARRRGEAIIDGDSTFGACPAVDELTVLLGSSNGRTFNRIGLIADPYVAGPYAEGSYDITVPVTDAILKTVRPAYADAFSRR